MPLVTSGVENGNLRELALARMKEKFKKNHSNSSKSHLSSFFFIFSKELGTSCRDVRTREIGIQEIHNKGIKPNNIELIRRDYCANGGWETFLEYGDPEQDILIGLLRLRKCSPQRYENDNCITVRIKSAKL